jgi:serine/threonine protein kinase
MFDLCINSGFGTVFMAVDQKTKQKVAIKKLNIDNVNEDALAAEMGIMKNCAHDNIVKFLGGYYSTDRLWVRYGPSRTINFSPIIFDYLLSPQYIFVLRLTVIIDCYGVHGQRKFSGYSPAS